MRAQMPGIQIPLEQGPAAGHDRDREGVMSIAEDLVSEALSALLAGEPAAWQLAARLLALSAAASAAAALVAVPFGATLASGAVAHRRVGVSVWLALACLPPGLVGLGLGTAGHGTNAAPPAPAVAAATLAAAQALVATPLVAALVCRTMAPVIAAQSPTLRGLRAGPLARLATCAREARAGIAAAVLAGGLRGVAEGGATLLGTGPAARAAIAGGIAPAPTTLLSAALVVAGACAALGAGLGALWSGQQRTLRV